MFLPNGGVGEDQTDAVMALAEESLISYACIVNKNYDANWHHYEIADKLQKVASGEIDRLMIFMPPRHGKSELASVLFPSWYLGKNPEKNVIAVSYGEDLSIGFGRRVRNIVQSPTHESIFPGSEMSQDSKKANRFNTIESGGYLATGINSSLTGFGADILIIDDPIKGRAEAESDTIRNQLKSWYSGNAYNRLEKGGAIIVIQTRWHEADLGGWLLDRAISGEGEEWTVIDYPAIAINDEPHRKAGEPLWPERYDLKSLNRIKQNSLSRDWQSLYQQRPSGGAAQKFFRTWFRYWNEMPEDLTFLTVVDPAFKKGKRNDFSVVMTVGFKGNTMYIIEYDKGQFTTPQLIDKVMHHAKKWNPIRVGVEAYAAQVVLGRYIREKFNEEKIYVDIEEITQRGSKEEKIESITPNWRAGKIIHHVTMIDLEQQLLSFPAGKHDDIIDCIQMAANFDIKSLPQNTWRGFTNDEDDLQNYNVTYNKYGEPNY